MTETTPDEFRLGVCITTMHRPQILDVCLRMLSECQPAPSAIVVSDDSKDPSQIDATRAVVARYPGVQYVSGPRNGVCANRNRALDEILGRGFDYVAFLDDDTAVPPNFFGIARSYYLALPAKQRVRTLLTGGRDDVDGGPVRLHFRGYFQRTTKPESATVCASVFPMALLATERWDENIFFGSEDAEICLRALARGFAIEYHNELSTSHLASNGGVLLGEQSSGMTRYEFQCEAARLYIGIKRYSKITPSLPRLALFVAYYFAHISVLLARRGLLGSLLPIVRAANLRALRPNAQSDGSIASA